MVANSLTWWFQSVEKAPTSLYIWLQNIIWIHIIWIFIMWTHAIGILIMWIHVIGIYIYHINSSSIFWQYISIIAWAMSGEHLSPIGSLKYLYLPNGVMMVQGSWLLLSNSKLLLHTIVKFSKKLVPRTLVQNVHDYRQRILLTSYDFVQLMWVTDPA
jgi:hypothetical protein